MINQTTPRLSEDELASMDVAKLISEIRALQAERDDLLKQLQDNKNYLYGKQAAVEPHYDEGSYRPT